MTRCVAITQRRVRCTRTGVSKNNNSWFCSQHLTKIHDGKSRGTQTNRSANTKRSYKTKRSFKITRSKRSSRKRWGHDGNNENENAPFQPQSYSLSKRLLLSEALAEGIVRTDLCDLNKYTSDVTFPQVPDHASRTIIFFAKMLYDFVQREPTASVREYENYWKGRLATANTEVVIKASFAVKDLRRNNGLQVEIAIYERFIYKLLNWNATPNLMMMIRFYQCPNFQEKLKHLTGTVGEGLKEISPSATSEIYDLDTLNLMVMERGKGETFLSWLYRMKNSSTKGQDDTELLSIIFQIAYTLVCLAEVGIRHNDLHANNVWIETPVAPQKFIYFIDPKRYFVVPIVSVVKIFDFDRASVWSPSIDPRTGKEDKQLYNTLVRSELNEPNTSMKEDAEKLFIWLRDSSDFAPLLSKRIKDWFAFLMYYKIDFVGKKMDIVEKKHTFYESLEHFPVFGRSLPEYDPRYLPDVFPNVFRLPSIIGNPELHQTWLQNLHFQNLKPVNF